MDISFERLYQLTATESINLIKEGKITITELTENIIQQIDKSNRQTNAWVHLNHKQSLDSAKKLDEKLASGQDLGPLYGLSIGIKDIFHTSDFPTEMGSPIWKGFTPGNDARVVYALKMANAIIVGKTETAEFAVHTLGKSKNPYDSNRSPGTSSSGSAVAVATNSVPIALGTQTGGSIIRPASYCGIYGFKPSFGLIPRTGMLKTTDTLDQIGYFARNPHDLELLFDSIRVRGRDYPLSEAALNDNARQDVSNRPWKIKFVKTPVWDQAESYAKKAIEKFVEDLNGLDSFQIDDFELPEEFSMTHKIHQIIYKKSLAYYFKDELEKHSLVSDIFYQFASQAKEIPFSQYEKALAFQSKIRNILDNLFFNFDIIISLSTAGEAPMKEELEKDDPSLIWTMCGNPAISMPAVITPSGLPMGIQAVSRRYNDKLLLSFIKNLYHNQLILDGPFPRLAGN